MRFTLSAEKAPGASGSVAYLIEQANGRYRVLVADSPITHRQHQWVNNSEGWQWVPRTLEVGSEVDVKVGRRRTPGTVVEVTTPDAVPSRFPSYVYTV